MPEGFACGRYEGERNLVRQNPDGDGRRGRVSPGARSASAGVRLAPPWRLIVWRMVFGIACDGRVGGEDASRDARDLRLEVLHGRLLRRHDFERAAASPPAGERPDRLVEFLHRVTISSVLPVLSAGSLYLCASAASRKDHDSGYPSRASRGGVTGEARPAALPAGQQQTGNRPATGANQTDADDGSEVEAPPFSAWVKGSTGPVEPDGPDGRGRSRDWKSRRRC